MRSVSALLVIVLCAFIAAASEAETEELSNDIAGEKTVAREPDSSTPSEEINSLSGSKTPVSSRNQTDDPSLEARFDNGVESYLNNDWENCIEEFEKAIDSYKEYKETVVGCRRKCRAESNAAEPIFPEDVEDYHFYGKKVRETLCLMKCKKIKKVKDMKDRRGLPELLEIKLLERKPYEYLHICYYQMKRHQDAANAMFTFLTLHRDNEQGLKNLRFYVNLPDVVEDEVVDLETDPFLAMYKAGVAAYNEENYPEVIERLENSIKAYTKAEDDCRFYCEGPFNHGWLPDFTMAIANHFVYGLRCKHSCSDRLNVVNGEYHADLLLDHYHYLQFAYFKTGQFEEACAAVESYLYFVPNDETVLRNKKYFLGLPEVKREYFEPRKEAVSYVERREYELRLLLYIQEEFGSFANAKN